MMKVDLEKARECLYVKDCDCYDCKLGRSLCNEVQTLRELVGVQKELIELFTDKLDDDVSRIYPWRKIGNKLRTKIAELEKK